MDKKQTLIEWQLLVQDEDQLKGGNKETVQASPGPGNINDVLLYGKLFDLYAKLQDMEKKLPEMDRIKDLQRSQKSTRRAAYLSMLVSLASCAMLALCIFY